MLRRFPIRAGRNDDKWCASPHPIDRLALADVRKGIAGLQRTFSKQKTTIEKLLPEIALLRTTNRCRTPLRIWGIGSPPWRVRGMRPTKAPSQSWKRLAASMPWITDRNGPPF
jgi:hypothetical protein